MSVSANLRRLIDTAAPYWAGEAEVVRTYWTWKGRTRETDRRWLARQCYKELLGAGLGLASGSRGEELGPFQGPLARLQAAFPKIDTDIDRHEVLGLAELLKDEFSHYCAFADAHDALARGAEHLAGGRSAGSRARRAPRAARSAGAAGLPLHRGWLLLTVLGRHA